MKLVHKSIYYELAGSFLLSIIALNFILMMEKLLKLSLLLSSVGASVYDLAFIVMYLQPQLLLLTIPMSFLIATLLTYGRLNTDNELTAMKACGMSFSEISRPVFAFGILCFLASAATSFYISPKGSLQLRESVTSIIGQRAPYAMDAGVFNTAFSSMVFFVKEKPSIDSMKGVFAYDGSGERPRMLYAEEGSIKPGGGINIHLSLENGFIHMAGADTSTLISFEKYSLALPLEIETPQRKMKELTPLELIRSYTSLEGDARTRTLLEFHRRFTLPSVCLALMFLSPPLSLIAGRRGRLGGLTVGFSVFALYYAALIYMENLAVSGSIPPAVAAWTPMVLLVAASVWAFRKASLR